MTTQTLDQIQETFFEALNDKTNWGRNEIKTLYKDSQLEVLKQTLDSVTEEEQ